MTTTITTTLTCPTMLQGVVGSSCEGHGFLSLALFVFKILCGTRRELQEQNIGENL